MGICIKLKYCSQERMNIGWSADVTGMYMEPKCLHTWAHFMRPTYMLLPKPPCHQTSGLLILIMSMSVGLNHLLLPINSCLFPGKGKDVIPFKVLPAGRVFHLHFLQTEKDSAFHLKCRQLIMQSHL